MTIFSNKHSFLNACVDYGAQELGRHLQVWSYLKSELLTLLTEQDVH